MRVLVARLLIASVILLAPGLLLSAGERIQIVPNAAARRVDVLIDGRPFTSYIYPTTLKKPVLYPLRTAQGTIVTRGFPLEPRRGERVDHPHHAGLWFQHGDVNGLDFWNNSDDIGPESKSSARKWMPCCSKAWTDGRICNRCGRSSTRRSVCIDKPFTAGYADAREIVRLSRESGVAFFSSSSLRFVADVQALKNSDKHGGIWGAFTFGPENLEPHHPDLFWYGIHAVEMLALCLVVLGRWCFAHGRHAAS